jgi:putative membrane protein
VLAVIIGLVVWLLNRAQYRGDEPRRDSAMDVLRRRFAAGDIDEDEYERRLSVLPR